MATAPTQKQREAAMELQEILRKDREDRQNRASEEIQKILDRENCAIVCSVTFDELRGVKYEKRIIALEINPNEQGKT